MRRRRRRSLAPLLAAACAACSFTALAFGDSFDVTWLNPTSGNFTDPANWSDGRVPINTSADSFTARFDPPGGAAGTFTVSFDGDVTNNGLVLNRQNLTLELAGHTYTILGAAWTANPADVASLTLHDGVLDGAAAMNGIAVAPAPDSRMNLTLDGATFRAGALVTGGGGGPSGAAASAAGTVSIANGGRLSVGDEHSPVESLIDAYGADAGATGAIAVSGATSSYVNARGTAVGRSGTGTFIVESGATATSGERVYAGLLPGSRGSIQIRGDGSTWTADTTNVGWQGDGELSISDGGHLINTSADNDSFIGFGMNGERAATGIATVSGTGSSWIMAPTLHVGAQGVGTLNITAGGLVQITNASGVPDGLTLSGSNGPSSVNVNGATSRLTTVGNIVIDHGAVSANDGGTIATNASLFVGRAALWDATLTIGGGGGIGTTSTMSSVTVAGSLTIGGAPRGNGVTALATVSAGGGLVVGHMTTLRDHAQLVWGNGGSFSTSDLSVRENAAILLTAGGDRRVLDVSHLTISDAGVVDLTDHAAIVHAQTSEQVANYIRQARGAASDWSGPGLSSSAAAHDPNHATTLGVLSGAEFKSINGATATFADHAVADSDVLVKYTYFGDTDFNGVVNFDDYVRADNGFNNHLSGWMNGDLDLNGVVNFDDYVLIDLAFNTQSGTLGRALRYLDGSDRSRAGMSTPALRRVQQDLQQFGTDYGDHFLAAVPEPAGAVAGMALVAISEPLRRHRRRRALRA